MTDPFLIDGPALISFSGGRTSAYMLWRILQAHGGTLPDDVKVTFANTGKEMPETLDFVRDCGERWSTKIHWLEYRWKPGEHSFEEVGHNSASRNGEPFDQVIEARSMLPNPVMRFCTVELKIRTMGRFGLTLWPRFDKVVGLRADEPRRVAKMRNRAEASREAGEADVLMPLATAGTTKHDVVAFWKQQDWGLKLPNANGRTPMGNCDLCFLKTEATLRGIMRERPDVLPWWVAKEAHAAQRGTLRQPEMALFRADRPSYAAMWDFVQRQGDAFASTDADDEAVADCYCMEDA